MSEQKDHVSVTDATARLIHGDVLDVLPTLADGSVSLVVLDPPHDQWDAWRGLFGDLVRVCPRCYVLAFVQDAHMYNVEWTANVRGWDTEAVFVWHDPQPIYTAQTRPLKTPEFVLVFKSGAPSKPNMKSGAVNEERTSVPKGTSAIGKWRGGQRTYVPSERKHLTSVLSFPRPLNGPLGRWQKPQALLECLIRAYSCQGDTVLDLFGGSGTTAAAAVALGRHAIHVEANAAHMDSAREQIGSLFIEAAG